MTDVKMTATAIASVQASLASPSRERTDQEKVYDELVASCVYKAEHVQTPETPENKGRLYTVTMLAASPRFGGTRTPVICDSFERAVGIVKTNEGDIWETTYQLVVVEGILPNMLYGGDLNERYWFRWDLDADGYRPIARPDERTSKATRSDERLPDAASRRRTLGHVLLGDRRSEDYPQKRTRS